MDCNDEFTKVSHRKNEPEKREALSSSLPSTACDRWLFHSWRQLSCVKSITKLRRHCWTCFTNSSQHTQAPDELLGCAGFWLLDNSLVCWLLDRAVLGCWLLDNSIQLCAGFFRTGMSLRLLKALLADYAARLANDAALLVYYAALLCIGPNA